MIKGDLRLDAQISCLATPVWGVPRLPPGCALKPRPRCGDALAFAKRIQTSVFLPPLVQDKQHVRRHRQKDSRYP